MPQIFIARLKCLLQPQLAIRGQKAILGTSTANLNTHSQKSSLIQKGQVQKETEFAIKASEKHMKILGQSKKFFC